VLWIALFGVVLAVVVNGYGEMGTSGAVFLGLASFTVFVAGSGLRASFWMTTAQRAAGSAIALAMLLVSLYLVSGMFVNVLSYSVPGWQWVLGVFAVSFALTTRKLITAV
jgi:hypothetical protein